MYGSSAIQEFEDKTRDVDTGDGTAGGTTSSLIGAIIYIMQILLVGVAIVMLMALGVKYMVSSIEDRVEIKKHLVAYVLGAVLLFSAAGIVSILKTFITGNFVEPEESGEPAGPQLPPA